MLKFCADVRGQHCDMQVLKDTHGSTKGSKIEMCKPEEPHSGKYLKSNGAYKAAAVAEIPEGVNQRRPREQNGNLRVATASIKVSLEMYLVNDPRRWNTKGTKGDQQWEPNDNKRTKEQFIGQVKQHVGK